MFRFGSRVHYPLSRRSQFTAEIERTSGRLERASSGCAGAIPRPSSRGRWYAVPPNKCMELTIKSVTPFAYAKGVTLLIVTSCSMLGGSSSPC